MISVPVPLQLGNILYPTSDIGQGNVEENGSGGWGEDGITIFPIGLGSEMHDPDLLCVDPL